MNQDFMLPLCQDLQQPLQNQIKSAMHQSYQLIIKMHKYDSIKGKTFKSYGQKGENSSHAHTNITKFISRTNIFKNQSMNTTKSILLHIMVTQGEIQ